MIDKPMSKMEDRLAASEMRDRMVRAQVEKERADSNAKILKLKALRLAKEAAESNAAPPPAPRKKKPKENPSAPR